MIPEFIGRLPVICPLMPLDVDALVQIMTEPRNALVKQYRRFFDMEGADVEFTPDALLEIAKMAKAKDTGARGLRSIVEDIMLDIMFELPDRAAKDKGKFIVTGEVVRKEKSLFDTPPIPLTPGQVRLGAEEGKRLNGPGCSEDGCSEGRFERPGRIAMGTVPMSTIDEPRTKTLPPLIAGQRLDQPTFHERYEAMPPETRAELVGGVVYMPSPMRDDHGEEGFRSSPAGYSTTAQDAGCRRGRATSPSKLLTRGEPQPDSLLYIAPELGGQSTIDEDGYFRSTGTGRSKTARSSRSFRPGAKEGRLRAGRGAGNTSSWSLIRTGSTGSSSVKDAMRTCLPAPTASSLGGFPRALARSGCIVRRGPGSADRGAGARAGDSRAHADFVAISREEAAGRNRAAANLSEGFGLAARVGGTDHRLRGPRSGWRSLARSRPGSSTVRAISSRSTRKRLRDSDARSP